MERLKEILDLIKKQRYITFSLTNNSSAWRGEWLLTINMMDGKGSHYFHHLECDGAIAEATSYIKQYYIP
jgi:hypothetical protein